MVLTALDRLRCVAALALPLAVLAALAALADTPRFRYALHEGPCFEAMIHRQAGDVDFVAVGGSRMLTAFDPYLFERAYRDAHGREITAYSMAHSWHGPDHAYPLLRDLLERRRVGHLVLMASDQRGDVYNPVAYSVATSRDLLAALDARPHDRIEHLSATLHMFAMRVRDVVFAHGRTTGYPAGARTCYPGDAEPNLPRLRWAQGQVVARGGFPVLDFDIGDPTQEFALYGYRRIVALARAHGARITFVYMPLLQGPEWSDATASRFEAAVGAPVLRLPVALRAELVRAGYRDDMHLVAPGRELFLPWLAGALGPSG